MNKRFVTLALAASSLGLLGTGILTGAHAASVAPGTACANQTNNSGSTTNSTVPLPADPVPGGPAAPNVYSNGSATSGSGYVGVSGSGGYIEAGGSATSGGYVSGSSTNAPAVNGAINVNQTSPNACFSGVQVP